MKGAELAAEFRRIFILDTDTFPPAQCHTEQGADDLGPDGFHFATATTPLDGIGRTLAYSLVISIQTHSRDSTPAEHAARVSAVQAKLFGSTAGAVAAAKAALTAAFVTGGKFTLRNYDAPPDAVDPALEQNRWRTAIGIRGIAVVTGPL